MKAMKMINIPIVFCTLFFLSSVYISKAQVPAGHLPCAPFCVYANVPSKLTVSCIDAVCKPCNEKREKDRKEHQAEEKCAMERRAKEDVARQELMKKVVAEQKKQIAAIRQQRKESEVVVVAPVVKTNNYIPPSKTEIMVDAKNFPTWMPEVDKQTGLLGFKEYKGDPAVWKITPRFVKEGGLEAGNTSFFTAGDNFAVVTLSTAGRRQGDCGGEIFLMTQAVIDRKGNTLINGGQGNKLQLVRGVPFVIKAVGTSATYSCSQEIYSIKEQRKVADIPGNFMGDKGYNIIFSGLEFTTGNSYSIREEVINQLKELYVDQLYDVAIVYYSKSIGWADGKNNNGPWTAYLMSKKGAFKAIQGQGPIYMK
ncbi:MAG: hypothetical protein QM731_05520 [Chitinophagaceae bacterium]